MKYYFKFSDNNSIEQVLQDLRPQQTCLSHVMGMIRAYEASYRIPLATPEVLSYSVLLCVQVYSWRINLRSDLAWWHDCEDENCGYFVFSVQRTSILFSCMCGLYRIPILRLFVCLLVCCLHENSMDACAFEQVVLLMPLCCKPCRQLMRSGFSTSWKSCKCLGAQWLWNSFCFLGFIPGKSDMVHIFEAWIFPSKTIQILFVLYWEDELYHLWKG